jgi:hypothetical protein
MVFFLILDLATGGGFPGRCLQVHDTRDLHHLGRAAPSTLRADRLEDR